MNLHLSLLNHPKQYSLDTREKLLFPIKSSYAKRHWELSKVDEAHWLGHKIIAIIEYIPIIGALASLIERITVLVLQKLYKVEDPKKSKNPKLDQPKKDDLITADQFEHKYIKNLTKALKDHQYKTSDFPEDFLKIDHANQPKLDFTIFEHEDLGKKSVKGKKSFMEDAHFYQKIDQGILFGLFDGHQDTKKVSGLAVEMFKENFSNILAQNPNNIRSAFQTMIGQIHQKTIDDKLDGGSTACICLIDKTNIIYTATLADTEAKVYRKIENKIYEIPLSCIRNWKYPKEAKRAAEATNMPEYAEEWPKAKDAKTLRFPNPAFGLNVSRTIGDNYVKTDDNKTALIQKAKITAFQLRPGDRVLFATDGYFDFVKNQTTNEVIAPSFVDANVNFAETACQLALSKQSAKNGDNVTVVGLIAK